MVALATYDWIAINSSGGKDSLAMMDVLAEQARREGVSDRVVVFYADLKRAVSPDSYETAEAQARFFGFRFESISRPQGDLLDQVEQRGMWPSPTNRWCTSDHKRDQGQKLLTVLTKERTPKDGKVRILYCFGFRRKESSSRAKKKTFSYNQRASTATTRDVWDYCPILDWSEDQVWERINKSGAPVAESYAQGLSRHSCTLCIFRSKWELVLGAILYPDLAAEYCRLERVTGHKFRQDISMREVVELAQETSVEDVRARIRKSSTQEACQLALFEV